MSHDKIHILGGGPAGLIAAYYAKQAGMPFQVYEASPFLGGNCRTFAHGDFLFDSGAHRFHDKDPEATALVKTLLGDSLRSVSAPSQIYHNGQFINFPLDALDVARKLSLKTVARIAGENLPGFKRKTNANPNFEEFATAKYGTSLASRFLLNYSEKLWGLSPDRLSPKISGNRLRGLSGGNLLLAALGRKVFESASIDGSFLYPEKGIGMICERLAEEIGEKHVRLRNPVQGLFVRNDRIQGIVLPNGEKISTEHVISTLPVTRMLKMLSPQPPESLLSAIRQIRFRQLRLIVLLLDLPQFSDNASIYFPESDIPWTRIYESTNRSSYMSPPGKTSIVIELPCFKGDEVWQMMDAEICQRIKQSLSDLGLLNGARVIESLSFRLSNAYPVLEHGIENIVAPVFDFLQEFSNLHLFGRSATFRYLHLHDLFREGRGLIEQLVSRLVK